MIVLVFLLGLFFGSFFGVIIDRTEKGKSIVKGRSKCDFCKKELSVLDLIPVLSFIFLKGKCRYCDKKLSLFYPLIEISAGLIFSLAYLYSPLIDSTGNYNFSFLYFLFIFSSLLILFFQDLKYGILSDKIIILTTIVSLFYFILFQNQEFINHLLTGIFSFVFFVLISLVFYFLTKKQGMGGGDIKLSFLLGLILGFPGAFISFYIAFL
ncbi:MAG TPA: prepilin peptidase, partial [Candidatus Sulfotelmatobacter sp.]|nr:prepilin peptidase [Candidatus Sulfotelmatobacter sp.]